LAVNVNLKIHSLKVLFREYKGLVKGLKRRKTKGRLLRSGGLVNQNKENC
jgi:hypothetical protein